METHFCPNAFLPWIFICFCSLSLYCHWIEKKLHHPRNSWLFLYFMFLHDEENIWRKTGIWDSRRQSPRPSVGTCTSTSTKWIHFGVQLFLKSFNSLKETCDNRLGCIIKASECQILFHWHTAITVPLNGIDVIMRINKLLSLIDYSWQRYIWTDTLIEKVKWDMDLMQAYGTTSCTCWATGPLSMLNSSVTMLTKTQLCITIHNVSFWLTSISGTSEDTAVTSKHETQIV